MKIVAINGSPHKGGSTYNALHVIEQECARLGAEFEIIQVGNKEMRGCIACGHCYTAHKCVFNDEFFEQTTQKMVEADGIILGSPVYYAGIAGSMKSFLDRAFYVNGSLFRHKVGFSFGVARRDGGITTFDQLNKYFLISEMWVSPSSYWLSVHGGGGEEVLSDEEGMDTLKIAMQNMAWMIQMKEATKDTVPPPEKVKKNMTNFIR